VGNDFPGARARARACTHASVCGSVNFIGRRAANRRECRFYLGARIFPNGRKTMDKKPQPQCGPAVLLVERARGIAGIVARRNEIRREWQDESEPMTDNRASPSAVESKKAGLVRREHVSRSTFQRGSFACAGLFSPFRDGRVNVVDCSARGIDTRAFVAEKSRSFARID